VIDERLLAILVCPETRQRLRPATAEELDRAKVERGFVREDGSILYPVLEGIPMLLPEHGVRIGSERTA
jgi:uncharacterized protein YbaR (Trm112 family)